MGSKALVSERREKREGASVDSGSGGGAAGERELLEAEARGRGRLEEAPGGAGPAGRTEPGTELRGNREVAGAAV